MQFVSFRGYVLPESIASGYQGRPGFVRVAQGFNCLAADWARASGIAVPEGYRLGDPLPQEIVEAYWKYSESLSVRISDYDVPSMVEEIKAAGRILEPIHVVKEDSTIHPRRKRGTQWRPYR